MADRDDMSCSSPSREMVTIPLSETTPLTDMRTHATRQCTPDQICVAVVFGAPFWIAAGLYIVTEYMLYGDSANDFLSVQIITIWMGACVVAVVGACVSARPTYRDLGVS